MSSPQSRQRQRHRRRAREKLWAAQKDLAERQVDVVSYTRVLADMEKCQLPQIAGEQARVIVLERLAVAARDCAHLLEEVADLEKAHAALAPSDPKATIAS